MRTVEEVGTGLLGCKRVVERILGLYGHQRFIDREST